MTRITMQRRGYHVLACENGWEVRAECSDRTLGRFAARDEAIAVARDAVEAEEGAQLVVHHPDGRVASQWPSDEAIALSALEVFDAGELAVDAPVIAAHPSDEEEGEIE